MISETAHQIANGSLPSGTAAANIRKNKETFLKELNRVIDAFDRNLKKGEERKGEIDAKIKNKMSVSKQALAKEIASDTDIKKSIEKAMIDYIREESSFEFNITRMLDETNRKWLNSNM